MRAGALERLKTALAARYAIQEEIGAGGIATVKDVRYFHAHVLRSIRWSCRFCRVTWRSLDIFL